MINGMRFNKSRRQILHRGTERVAELEGRSREERLRMLGLSPLERRGLSDDLVALCSSLRRGHGEGGAEIFSRGSRDRTRGNGSKLCQGRFRLDMREEAFL